MRASDMKVSEAAPTLYLFAGSNGAGKTTFARAYLRQLEMVPRFLNADELARGLSPLAPQAAAVRAGKLLLREIDDCLGKGDSFGLESTLSGTAHVRLIRRAKDAGYQVEIHYLWIASVALAIRRIAQRVKMGGHSVPEGDVRRRFKRSRKNFTGIYAPLADLWMVWDNRVQPPHLLLSSERGSLSSFDQLK